MRKNLQARQQAMRDRMLQAAKAEGASLPAAPKRYVPPPRPPSKHINFSARMRYDARPEVIPYYPRVNGVYLLFEDGRYYIGESVDVLSRVMGHRVRNDNSGFTDPKAVLLARVPLKVAAWNVNKEARLVAERRFIAAALVLGLSLVNRMSDKFKTDVVSQFSDLQEETERLREALKILC